MRPKARFIKSVIEAARQNQTALPWTRGQRRAPQIGARHTPVSVPRIRTA